MRLAYFTPLPPSKSGIADYNAELLPYLARGAEVAVFVEKADEMGEQGGGAGFSIHDAADFDGLHRQSPFDLCVYHQGNNPHHEYIYERALKTPGLLVLHEHCLHHLIALRTLGREDKDAYWDEMFYTYGRRGARMADMRDDAVGSDYQQFLTPLNRRIVSRSLGVIVHNEYAASQLEGARENVPVEIIPHHLSRKAYDLDRMDKAECRRSLGIPEDAWVIASFGYVTQSKRIPTVLAAFKRLLQQVPNAMFLVVGEDHWKWSVAPLIEEMGLREHARLTGYTSEQDFFRYLKAVDIVVNLRFPTAGETSGTLIRSLGAGKPVVVTDFGQFAELPDDVCLKVPLSENEERDVYLRLRALTNRHELRERLCRRAAEWIRSECEISRSAARHLSFAERLIEKRRRSNHHPQPKVDYQIEFKEPPTIKLDRDEALDYVAGFFSDDPAASGYIQFHRDRLIRTLELIPVGDKDQRFLELSSYLQMPLLVKRYGNYGEIAVTNWWEGEPREKFIQVRNPAVGEEFVFPMKNVDVERDPFPFPDGYFDVTLCCELIEHLREDPMHMLSELNRILKWGGMLILTTPNITSAFSVQEALAGRSPNIYNLYNRQSPADRHSREFTPTDVRVAFEAAGFKVLHLFTEDVWHKTDEEFLSWLDHTGVPRELRGDNIYAVGRKQSAQIDRYPHELYD
jgi:glycosyltransferase involved in cell wall biosynthesis/SAM-dependent methyltransferase